MSISLREPSGLARGRTVFFKDQSNLWLGIILLVATFLRFFALDRQSLWLDELHTMNEASPTLPFKQLFLYLTCCDQHPPLYFFCEKFLFTVFGYTSFVARFFSAVIGVGTVWVMYLLGKELSGKRLGLIAAAITCVNFYAIEYSQEARGYIMAFFFAALSYLFFFRLVKKGGRKNIWLYALTALGVMYSHYYGLFLVTGQYVTVGVVWLLEKSGRKSLFRNFLFSALVIVAGYIPWLPFLGEMAQIKSFWIGKISLSFVKQFFYGYFGNTDMLDSFLILALIYFTFRAVRTMLPFPKPIKSSTLALSFITFFLTILVTYGIPYIRSILVVPMLFDRYTIVVLPAFLAAIAFGFDLIPSNLLRWILFAAFLIITLTGLFVSKEYYTKIRKTQFRELTEFLVQDTTTEFPIINQRTAWQHQYYLDHYQYKGRVIIGQKDAMVDSILSKSNPTYDLAGFWIVGAHADETKLTDSSRAALATAYDLVKKKDFYDAWAELYVLKQKGSEVVTTGFDKMELGLDKFPNNIGILGKERLIAIFGGPITSLPVPMQSGHYNINILAMGFPSQNIFPHLKVYVNDNLVGEFFVRMELTKKDFDFEIKNPTNARIKIEMDNDFSDASGDRNAFISKIVISKK